MGLPLGSVVAVGPDGRERRLDAAQVERDTLRAASALARSGVAAGDRVIVRLPKRYEWLLALGALYRLGAVSVLCPELTPDAELAARARQLGARLSLLEPGDVAFADSPGPPAPAPGSDAPAFVLFTSGSSGQPKAAVHARRYVRANWLQTVRWMGVRPGDRVWCTAGTGWSKSLRNTWIAPWLRGAETVLHEGRFDPEERLGLIARLRPSVLCMSPTELRLCAKAPSFESADLSSVREVVAAGEPLGDDVLARYREQHGLRIRDGYGQTETGGVAGVPTEDEPAPGCLGRPLDGVDLRLDERGEIMVRAASVPTFFLGYLDPSGAQTPALLEDGWWRTGDRARQDEQGRLWFEGRADDVIISAGYRIGPVEVESALGSHPAVLEAAAVARPDAERGHVVHAVVVLQPGFAPSESLTIELQTHCKRVASPVKYPRSIAFATSLPKTESGKILRAQLRNAL
jgi:acyl-coenzyme A synthetase/AMP-(fatty) acid ligase